MTIDGTDEVLEYAENIPITPDEAVEAAVAFAGVPHRKGAFRRLLRRPGPTIALCYLVVLGVVALFAPWIAPYDPNQQDIPNRLAHPSWSHLLGTDNLGRDLFSRILYGARISLGVSVSVIAISMTVALVIGLFSGYAGGKVDSVLMRVADGGLSFPPLVLALAVAGILGPGVRNVILALSIVFVFGLTRLVRGSTLAISQESFIEASRAAGSRTPRILRHRVLPNIRSPLLIAATFGIAAVIVAEAALGYLGLGPRPPTASWGSMLRQAYERALYSEPWQLLDATGTNTGNLKIGVFDPAVTVPQTPGFAFGRLDALTTTFNGNAPITKQPDSTPLFTATFAANGDFPVGRILKNPLSLTPPAPTNLLVQVNPLAPTTSPAFVLDFETRVYTDFNGIAAGDSKNDTGTKAESPETSTLYVAPHVSAPAAAVRPWKLYSSAAMCVRFGLMRNAIFSAFSFASAPLLTKNTRPKPGGANAASFSAASSRTLSGSAFVWNTKSRLVRAIVSLKSRWP